MPPAPVKIALLASRIRNDEKLLIGAFERQAVSFTIVDSRTLWLELGGDRPEWTLAVNREIGFARALYAARALEMTGATVVNSARATEVCGDKWQTSVALTHAGITTPRTALALTPEAAVEALGTVGYPAVIKPLVGSWGRLVTPVADEATGRLFLEYVAALPHPASHIVYVQEMVDKGDRDIRVAVVGGRPLAAAYRSGPDWRTNVHRGASTQPCELTDDLAKLAARAADAVGADIAGVDIVEDADGQLTVLEVNHGFEFSGLQSCLGDRRDVAADVVSYLVDRARAAIDGAQA
jgi:[lysine-biosynthesis-protein LysW]--L-2-aminoadipate ligase